MLAGATRKALVAALTAAVAFYVYNSVSKFLQRKVSTSVGRAFAPDGGDPLPRVTVCSDLKDRSIREFIRDGNVTALDLIDASYGRRDLLFYAIKYDDPTSSVHLINNDSLWSESFQHHSGTGLCHTLSAPLPTPAGRDHRLSLLLQDPHTVDADKDCADAEWGGCRVYLFLHHGPEYIFRYSDEPFADQAAIYPAFGETMTFAVSRRETRRMDKDGDRCDGDADLDGWKRCLARHYDEQAGCAMPFYHDENASSLPGCDRNATRERLSWEPHLGSNSVSTLVSATGCAPPCSYVHYDARRIQGKKASSSHISPRFCFMEFYYLESVTVVVEEFLAFDEFSLLGEVGGALGLFLGWSCLNCLDDCLRSVATNKKTSSCRRRRRRHDKDIDGDDGTSAVAR